MSGHNYRRFEFNKRTHNNQYLGPFINHEMNRCIACYRCVRFYREYAGGRDFNVFASRNRVFFGRYEDGVLENEFSGNLVEVCPTGVFTDKTYKKHYTRKWDLTIHLSQLQSWLQYYRRRTLRHHSAHFKPLQRTGKWIFYLRPRTLWLRIREQ